MKYFGFPILTGIYDVAVKDDNGVEMLQET